MRRRSSMFSSVADVFSGSIVFDPLYAQYRCRRAALFFSTRHPFYRLHQCLWIERLDNVGIDAGFFGD